MADNIERIEKETNPLKTKKILALFGILVILVATFVIGQRFYQETMKDESRKQQSTLPRNSEGGVGLHVLVGSMQKDRDSKMPPPTPIVMSVPQEEKIVEVRSAEPAVKPIQIFIKPPETKPQQVRVPDEDMIKLGAQVRNSKMLALQAPSRVGGFIEIFPPQQSGQPQNGTATNQGYPNASELLSSIGGNGNNLAQSQQTQQTQQVSPPDPNNQKGKQDFLYGGGASRTPQGYSTNVPIPQQFPFELKAGSIIPGIMVTGLNSDLPGAVIGQVSEHVYDTSTGKHVLIPKGSRIIGAYDSTITYGQKRVVVVWNRIIAPNGTTLNISGSQGMDRAGYSGMSGRVDEHWGKLLSTALLASAFVAGAEILNPKELAQSATGSTPAKTPGQIFSESVANTAIEVGARLMEKVSNIQPTIKIRPGARFNIFVAQDIVFPEVWR